MLLLEALHYFEESLYDGRLKGTTRKWYIRFDGRGRVQGMLKPLFDFCGNVEVTEIDVFVINRWLKSMHGVQTKWGGQRPVVEGEALSPETINGRITSAKRFFNWLHMVGIIDHNPAAALKRIPLGDRSPKAVKTADFISLLESIANHSKQRERDLAILIFLFDTGVRVGGLCGIKLSDVEIEEKRVYVHEKGRGYNGSGRWVFLEPTPLLALTTYLEVRPEGRGKNLFVSQRGDLTSGGVYQMLERQAQLAGIEGFWNPHSFRHAAARAWLRGGASLPAVAKLLGHSNVLTTSKYYARWARSELQQIKHEASPFNDVTIDDAVSRYLEPSSITTFCGGLVGCRPRPLKSTAMQFAKCG